MIKESPNHAKNTREKRKKKAEEEEKQEIASDWEIQEELDRIYRI